MNNYGRIESCCHSNIIADISGIQMSVWVSGMCYYETTGVIHLLNSNGIVTRNFRAGSSLCSGDILIIGFSSVPLLGWWRYLKLTQWVANRYDVQLIIICSENVYCSGVIRGRNMVAINGERELFQLTLELLPIVQNFSRKGGKEHHQKYMWSVFQEKASQALSISPSSETDVIRARKAYSQRSLMLQHLGFATLLKLRVFMAGENLMRSPPDLGT